MSPEVAKSVKKLVKARFQKGMPLTKLERMMFQEMSEEDEEKAKKLWEEFNVQGWSQYRPVPYCLVTVVDTTVFLDLFCHVALRLIYRGCRY